MRCNAGSALLPDRHERFGPDSRGRRSTRCFPQHATLATHSFTLVAGTAALAMCSTGYELLALTSASAHMVGPSAMTSAGPYAGMRVKITGTLSTTMTCPPELTYTSTGG